MAAHRERELGLDRRVRERERQTDSETERQGDRERQTEKETCPAMLASSCLSIWSVSMSVIACANMTVAP